MDPATAAGLSGLFGQVTQQRNNTNYLTNTEPARRTNAAFWILIFLSLAFIAFLSYQLLKK